MGPTGDESQRTTTKGRQRTRRQYDNGDNDEDGTTATTGGGRRRGEEGTTAMPRHEDDGHNDMEMQRTKGGEGNGGERTAEGTKATGRGRHWPYHTQNGPKMTSIVVWAPGKFFLVRFLFFSFRLTLFFIYYRFYLCITTTYDPPSTITATSPSRSMSRRATARTAAAARDCFPGGNKEQRDGTTMPRDRDRAGDEQQ